MEGVSETIFGDNPSSPNNSAYNDNDKEVEQQSQDPFNIYDLLKKHPKGDTQGSNSSLSHPPGFTPEVLEKRQENEHVVEDLHNETDKETSPLVHAKVMSNSQEVHENMTSKEESALHSTHNSQTGGSILEVMDSLIWIGQSMGYTMEGCKKDIENIIGSQGVGDVPQ